MAFAAHFDGILGDKILTFPVFQQLVEGVILAPERMGRILHIGLGAQVPFFRLGRQKRAVRASHAKNYLGNFFLP